jgi:hypothetical protein
MNLASTIIPKSDQLNADDLISGPRVIRITEVRSVNTPEQPVAIHYEGDTGRPYKPCKSMRRVLVSIWGGDGAQYVGRSLRLYRDSAVRFGPDEVGGIRISHATHLPTGKVMLALTVTRGKRRPYSVELLEDAQQSPAEFDEQTLRDIGATKVSDGMASLREWWATLPAAAKTKLKPTLDHEWKAAAEVADKRKANT